MVMGPVSGALPGALQEGCNAPAKRVSVGRQLVWLNTFSDGTWGIEAMGEPVPGDAELTVDEAVEAFNGWVAVEQRIHRATLYRWVNEGRLAVHRVERGAPGRRSSRTRLLASEVRRLAARVSPKTIGVAALN